MKYVLVVVLAFVIIIAMRPKSARHASHAPQTALSQQIDDRPAEAERLIESTNGKVLFVFWQPNCPGCMEMDPIIAQVEHEYPNVKVVKINTRLDGNRAIHDKYGIHGTPTFIVFENGKIVRQHPGPFNDKQEYIEFLRPSRVY
jgi:thiol-disulfide isomerase/thioredoxin